MKKKCVHKREFLKFEKLKTILLFKEIEGLRIISWCTLT